MKKHVNNNFVIIFVAIFSISINAEYRLGLDYTIVDNPLPVKKERNTLLTTNITSIDQKPMIKNRVQFKVGVSKL